MFALHIIPFLFIVRTVLGGDTETQNTSTLDTIRNHRNDTGFLSTATAPPWVASPNTRGTGDILFTCLLTMLACIYTAIHPHVPIVRSRSLLGLVSVSWLSLIKITLAIDALLTPELLLYAAIQEHMNARSLYNDLRDIISRRRNAGFSDPDETSIDDTFCYFATMGGFRVSIEDIHPSRSAHFSTRRLPRDVSLSPDGIRLLAELGHLSLLVKTAGDVEGKSKANTFQKCLAAGQLCWMVIQCTVRKCHGLPVPLLEVHTFAHALFSVLMYAAWFKKPLDIAPSSCVLLPTEDFEDALALMVQEQFCESHNIVACLYPERRPENESSTIAVSGDTKQMLPFDEPGSPALMPVYHPDGNPIKVTWIDPNSPKSLLDPDRTGMVLPCGFGFAKVFAPPVTYHGWYSLRRAEAFRAITSPHRQGYLSRKDKLRAERVMRQIVLLDGKPLQSPQPYVNCEDVCLKERRCRYPMLKYRRAFYSVNVHHPLDPVDMPDDFEGDDDPMLQDSSYMSKINANNNETMIDAPLAIPTFGVATTPMALLTNNNISSKNSLLIAALFGLNGGIHMAAWNYIFPTKVECQAWRVVSLASTVIGLGMVLVRVLTIFLRKFTGPHQLVYPRNGAILAGWILLLELGIIQLPLYFLLLFVMFGRLYLNVEAFISLRHMPYGVFVMPSWLEVLPHL
ncbi:uncharacterized protein B0T23DRAFT_102839 [Neurospora hispaniola]|uniref:Uncharacterized protein n=1 Tax=Neurospora hispaniola TaxID=588809 RepID=A0AAJ0I929_9PEZI|nr:hypothetical protein B0T23DRAFT_102839 [Neurospora hispaniola]